MNPKIGFLFATILLFLTLTGSPTFSLSQIPYASKPGPVFQTASGHNLYIAYDSKVSEEDVQVANSILNLYIPKLFELFWSPTDDVSVEIHKAPCLGATGEPSCESFTDVYINPDRWGNPRVWVHEFTHILQRTYREAPGLAAPLSSFQNEAYLLYTEPTAAAVTDILAPLDATYWRDLSFSMTDYGVAEAIYNYNNYRTGETHAQTSVWHALYRADHNVFLEVNSLLHELAKQSKTISTASELRTLISDAVPIKVLDGLPLYDWLRVEGMLGRQEVGTSVKTFPFHVAYQTVDGTTQQFELAIKSMSVSESILPDPKQSYATIYDALTRSTISDVELQTDKFDNYLLFNQTILHQQQPASVIRVELDVAALNYSSNLGILLPLYSNQTDSSTNVILTSSPDGWLQRANYTLTINDHRYYLHNGIVKFNLSEPRDVSLSTDSVILIRNFVPSLKIMLLGINYSALTKAHPSPLSHTSEADVILGHLSEPVLISGLIATGLILIVAILLRRKRN